MIGRRAGGVPALRAYGMSDEQQPAHAINLGRRQVILGAPLAFSVGGAALARAAAGPSLASYDVRLLGLDPLRFAVNADLPIAGRDLAMADTYPAELPAMAAGGWPTVVSGLEVRDRAGQRLAVTPVAQAGWRLDRNLSGRVRLAYVADFGIFQAAGWSSPRESAVIDAQAIAVCARGLFIVTDQVAMADIGFAAPAPWQAVAPWPRLPRGGRFRAGSAADLTDNFVVLSRSAPDLAAAAGFRMQITAMGHWQPLRPLVRQAVRTIVTRQVAMMGFGGSGAYNVVLAPTNESAGEAYRQSLLYTFEDPGPANVGDWANTIAHEVFHYWNGARLKGSDYPASQWFQEGFTEYVANLTLVNGKIVTPDAFLAKLGIHVANARKLATTLENIGTRKGPPLYSAGALVALAFDVMLRQATAGRRGIGFFFRNLWQRTHAGTRTYAWADIEAALAATATADWRGFYLSHIRGKEPLPLAATFGRLGLKLGDDPHGNPVVAIDPLAPRQARQLWRNLVAGPVP